MQSIYQFTHPDTIEGGTQYTRPSVRALIAHNDKVLLLYTKRYEDYSLPGGGVHDGESLEQALLREVHEETGAQGLKIIGDFGLVEELRPCYKTAFDNVYMLSYCYLCQAEFELGEPELERYEIANGMSAHWVNLNNAIAHNEALMAESDKIGLSIVRETWLLKRFAEYLAAQKSAELTPLDLNADLS